MSTDEDEPFDILSMVVDHQQSLKTKNSAFASLAPQIALEQDPALEHSSSSSAREGNSNFHQVSSIETRNTLKDTRSVVRPLYPSMLSFVDYSRGKNVSNMFKTLEKASGPPRSVLHECRDDNIFMNIHRESSKRNFPIVISRETITRECMLRTPNTSRFTKTAGQDTSCLIQVPFTNETSDSETDDTDSSKITVRPPHFLSPYLDDFHTSQKHNSGRATMEEFQQCFRESVHLSPSPLQRNESSVPPSSFTSQFETPEIRVVDGIDPNTRVSRRRATNAMGLMKIDDDALSETSSQDKRKLSPPPVIERNYKRRKIDSKWTADTLLSNTESPFANAKLNTSIFQECWDLLSHSEKRECLALLPSFDKTDFGFDLSPTFFNNRAFEEQCKSFQDDLRTGKMTLEYEQKAKEAKKYRKSIETTESKIPNPTTTSTKRSLEKRVKPLGLIESENTAMPIKRIKVFYNNKPTSGLKNHAKKKSVPPSRELAGEQVQIRMSQMFEHGYLQLGDIWTYNRGFASEAGKFRSSFSVIKNVRLLSIDDRGLLTFECPVGPESELSRGNIKVLRDVRSPTMLEGLMLEEDGRIGREVRTNGNAFKLFRITRCGKDIGSLFDVRKRAWELLQKRKIT